MHLLSDTGLSSLRVFAAYRFGNGCARGLFFRDLIGTIGKRTGASLLGVEAGPLVPLWPSRWPHRLGVGKSHKMLLGAPVLRRAGHGCTCDGVSVEGR